MTRISSDGQDWIDTQVTTSNLTASAAPLSFWNPICYQNTDTETTESGKVVNYWFEVETVIELGGLS